MAFVAPAYYLILSRTALASQVHDTYQRLAGMVDEQGKDLDTIETNVIDAEASTQAGVGHLNKAASYQKQYGRFILVLVVILLLIAAAVGGYYGYKEVRRILLTLLIELK